MIGDGFERALDEARRGLDRGFSELYRDLAPAVLGFVRGQGVPDPEDTLAEIMVSVARAIATFQGDEASFRSWVFTIAYRRVTDTRRRGSRRVREVALDGAGERGTPITAEDVALGALEYGPLADALGHLKPVQRDVVLLRVVAGLPIVDVATIVAKSETAVKMIQVRALEHLRSLVSPDVALDPATADSERR